MSLINLNFFSLQVVEVHLAAPRTSSRLDDGAARAGSQKPRLSVWALVQCTPGPHLKPSWHTLLWDTVVKPVVDNAVCQNNVETTKAESNDFWHVYKLHSSFCHLFRLNENRHEKRERISSSTENLRWFSSSKQNNRDSSVTSTSVYLSYVRFRDFLFSANECTFVSLFLLMHRASLSGWNEIRRKGWVAWYDFARKKNPSKTR